MKYFSIILATVTLFGCTYNTEISQKKSPEKSHKTTVQHFDISKNSGVKTTPATQPQKKIRTNPQITCEKTQKPVCAKISARQKNSFLNKCEAERHYADILNNGTCKKEKTAINNCQASVIALGNCQKIIMGWEYSTGKGCKEITVSGCDADIPFMTKESCQKSCQK